MHRMKCLPRPYIPGTHNEYVCVDLSTLHLSGRSANNELIIDAAHIEVGPWFQSPGCPPGIYTDRSYTFDGHDPS